jgi:type IV pilus assembly protein PilW
MSARNIQAVAPVAVLDRRARRAFLQAGVGLVEIMISITIGLVIVGALAALFVGTSRNNRQMATANSMIENGRFAIQLLEDDVIHAGYWGSFVPEFDDQTESATTPPPDVPTALPDPCAAYGGWDAAYRINLIGIPAQAYDTAAVCAGIVPDMLVDTDMLVVRHLDTCIAGDTGCEADTAGKLYLQPGQCDTEIGTHVLGLTGTDTFDRTRRDCATAAEKRRFVSHIYYVREDYPGNTTGVPIPTLMRSEFDMPAVGVDPAHLDAVPLVEGIDGFRVEFGIDDVSRSGDPVDYSTAIVWDDPDDKTIATNRGDAIPDGAYVHCTPCTADDLMNATSVRIYILARSRESTQGYVDTKTYDLGAGTTLGPYNDGFKRHVYTTTVQLPNTSGRRLRP